MKNEISPPTKKGIFALIKESLDKISSGCGPGCGCHVEEKEVIPTKDAPKDDKK